MDVSNISMQTFEGILTQFSDPKTVKEWKKRRVIGIINKEKLRAAQFNRPPPTPSPRSAQLPMRGREEEREREEMIKDIIAKEGEIYIEWF